MSKGVSFGSVAINLSASSQCREADFAERLLEDISRRGLPTSAVQVEVTEGVFLSGSGDSVLKACKTLSNGGVRISFDDFGTGFASLTHLRDFPVDELKIDRSFVGDLTRKGNLAIVAAMVSLGNNLAMSVVAEGLETEAQAHCLRAWAVDTPKDIFIRARCQRQQRQHLFRHGAPRCGKTHPHPASKAWDCVQSLFVGRLGGQRDEFSGLVFRVFAGDGFFCAGTRWDGRLAP
jgi:predicted signal transduction protein with EAL and GGDEF domain